MSRQIELFRENGVGNFHDLVLAVAQDPAMLVFLDAGENIKGQPNENFAREILGDRYGEKKKVKILIFIVVPKVM